jgi:hypothetical protein
VPAAGAAASVVPRVALGKALHLAVLCAFAFVQPLLDILGRNPTFFVVRDSSQREIVVFALALEGAVSLVDRRTGRVLHLVLVAAGRSTSCPRSRTFSISGFRGGYGRSPVGRRPAADGAVTVLVDASSVGAPLSLLREQRARRLAKQTAAFGVGPFTRVYRVGRNRALVGKSPSDFPVRHPAGTAAKVDGSSLLGRVDPTSGFVPSFVEGSLTPKRGSPLELAVAVGDRIAAVPARSRGRSAAGSCSTRCARAVTTSR